jgi:hypothetical protein
MNPNRIVGARVPIHFAVAMSRVWPRGPRRETNIAMNSPDMSRFCKNALYCPAFIPTVPNSAMNSHWIRNDVMTMTMPEVMKRGLEMKPGNSERP